MPVGSKDVELWLSLLAEDLYKNEAIIIERLTASLAVGVRISVIVQSPRGSEVTRAIGELQDRVAGAVIYDGGEPCLCQSRNLALRYAGKRFLVLADWDTDYAWPQVFRALGLLYHERGTIGFSMYSDNPNHIQGKVLVGLSSESIKVVTGLSTPLLLFDRPMLEKTGLQLDTNMGINGSKRWLPFGEEFKLAVSVLATDSRIIGIPLQWARRDKHGSGFHAGACQKLVVIAYALLTSEAKAASRILLFSFVLSKVFALIKLGVTKKNVC